MCTKKHVKILFLPYRRRNPRGRWGSWGHTPHPRYPSCVFGFSPSQQFAV